MYIPWPSCTCCNSYVHLSIVNNSSHRRQDSTLDRKSNSLNMRPSHLHNYQSLHTLRLVLYFSQFKYLLLSLWSLYTHPVCILCSTIRELIDKSGIESHSPRQYPVLYHFQLPRSSLPRRCRTQLSLCKLYTQDQNRRRSPCKYYHRGRTKDPYSSVH